MCCYICGFQFWFWVMLVQRHSKVFWCTWQGTTLVALYRNCEAITVFLLNFYLFGSIIQNVLSAGNHFFIKNIHFAAHWTALLGVAAPLTHPQPHVLYETKLILQPKR